MNQTEKDKIEKFALPYRNIIYVLAGLLLMVAGYILMMGGGSSDPAQFNGERMFSFTRIILSPLLILIGFGVEIFAIMHKPRKA